ncbi:MAG TPA: hypothetical protein VJP77_04990, partial [Planctomycetota bacterium]|nr:hypothetical protein [Planctomycetota bacterium]
ALGVLLGLGLLLVAPARHAWFRLEAPKSKPLWHVENWEREHRPKAVTLTTGERVVYAGGYRAEGDGFVVRTPYGDERWIAADLVPRNPDGTVPVEDASLVEFTEWTSLSRVDAFTWPGSAPPWGLWGLSPAWSGPKPRQKGITIDTWAMTNVLEWDRSGPPPEIVEYLPASLVHRIVDAPEVLIVGAGGGMDLLTAERFGASRIVGVEINPSIVRAVRERFLDFQGGLYDPARSPHVELHVAEGRHFLERETRRFDVVQLSGVDTASTTQAGAFALSENFLYTVEAFDTYLARTKDDGFVTLTRWVLPDPATGHPRETLRLFALAWGALERARDRGEDVPDVAGSVYLIDSQGFSVVVFGRRPFTDEQLATLDATRDALRARSLYHPRDPSPLPHPTTGEPLPVNWYEAFAAAPDKGRFLADYSYDVAPPRDNRPFFFEVSRFRNLLDRESLLNPLGGLTAHAIVIGLLALLGAAALLFVVLPLVRLRGELRGGVGGGARAPVLVYFGCLGLGFILVEVVLTQQFNLYLGNPLYALAVVLFSVLVFSGVGSALSSRVGEPRRALAVVVALAALYPWLLDPVFDATLGLPTGGRIAVSVALLAPLALAMGMPFPLGLSRIAAEDSRLTAWAWGVNGYTSVVGSALTILLSLALGFRAVVWIGALVYLLAFAVAPGLRRRLTLPV